MTHYRHIKNKDGHPVITLAIERIESGKNYDCNIGIAFCNPKDSYNRKLGRIIAEGRLYKGKVKAFEVLEEENTIVHDQTGMIVSDHFASFTNIPTNIGFAYSPHFVGNKISLRIEPFLKDVREPAEL